MTALAGAGAALVSAVLLLPGCSSKACTEIGCLGGATVTLAGAIAAWAPMLPMNLDACVDGGCQRFRVERDDGATICRPSFSGNGFGTWRCVTNDAGNVVLVVPVGSAGSHSISLVAADDANAQLFQRTGSVDATPFYPNGPDCGGACFQGTSELQP